MSHTAAPAEAGTSSHLSARQRLFLRESEIRGTATARGEAAGT
jgi:hypothetical protein